jgi:hypothetical protein
MRLSSSAHQRWPKIKGFCLSLVTIAFIHVSFVKRRHTGKPESQPNTTSVIVTLNKDIPITNLRPSTQMAKPYYKFSFSLESLFGSVADT